MKNLILVLALGIVTLSSVHARDIGNSRADRLELLRESQERVLDRKPSAMDKECLEERKENRKEALRRVEGLQFRFQA